MGKDSLHPQQVQLIANEGIRFDRDGVEIQRHGANATPFVRTLPQKSTLRAGNSIGVNFTDRGQSDLAPNEQTGVVKAGNWNNVDGNPLPPPTVRLHDATGKSSEATLSWQWLSKQGVPKYRICPSHIESPAVYPFEKLMDGRFNGVIDVAYNNGIAIPKSHQTADLEIRVRGLPYSHYRVCVYYTTIPAANDHSNPEMHTFGLSVNGCKPLIVCRPRTELNDFYQYESESRSGNYQLFEGLSGDLTIAATTDGPGPLHDKFIAGFQIIEAQP
jgi:hypothetical protein